MHQLDQDCADFDDQLDLDHGDVDHVDHADAVAFEVQPGGKAGSLGLS